MLELYHRTMLSAKRGGAVTAQEYQHSVRTMLHGMGIIHVIDTPASLQGVHQRLLPLAANDEPAQEAVGA